MLRSRTLVVAIGFVVAACAGSDAGVSVGPASRPSTTAAAPDVTVTSTTVVTEVPATQPPTTGSVDPDTGVGMAWPGAPEFGLGDPLYPELGAPGLDTLRYDLELRYDLDDGSLVGELALRFTTTSERTEVALDADDNLEIERVTLDGSSIPVVHADDELIVESAAPFEPGSEHDLDVSWRVTPVPIVGADGIPVGWFATADGSFVLGEPDGLSTWMPANDHPSDKAQWRFSIEVPSGYTAVANGALVEHVSSSETERWVWEPTEPMATYLVLVLTGRFVVVDDGEVDGVRVQHAVLSADRAALEPVLALTDDMLEFFSGLFGPYPFDTYGLAVTEAVPGLAMETQTRSLFDRNDLLGDRVSETAELLLAHELAHQWFGDAVSPAAWSDIWLNEGFATYGEWLWFDEAGLTPLRDSAARALAQPRAFVLTDPPAELLFDRTVYDGGGVVLHALRGEVGDDAFFDVVRGWATEARYESRTTADFVAFAEDTTGRDLSEFFDVWLFTDRTPTSFPTG